MDNKELKVSEFERAADLDKPYKVNKNFQQTYGPETNYSYKANSADEILGDTKKLASMILNHHRIQCPRLAALDNYCKARNDGIYDDNERRREKGKADHRAAHNFAKVIIAFDVGYNTGIPIKKSSDIEGIDEIIKEYDKENDIEALDSELWRDFRKFGRAYELQYRNTKDKCKSVISNVFETFVCYGLDVERTPLFAVRYPRYWVDNQEYVKVIVYTDKYVITYKPCKMEQLNLEEEDRSEHFWGEVPVTEYFPDRYRQSGFEDVISLIDLYDSAQSDTGNYMSDFNEATLVVTGDIDLGKYTVKEMIEMKKANMLLLSNGINPDGSKSQTDAKYIYKQYDVAGNEAFKSRLRDDIHYISMIPNLADESFSGTQSGEAMKYKLWGFQQICKTTQNGFTKAITRRYKLLLNIKKYVSEADNADLGDFKVVYTPNLPKAILDELKVLIDAGAEISQKTLLELASFIDDVSAELERLEEEEKKREESDPVIKKMFGTGQNKVNGDVVDGEE